MKYQRAVSLSSAVLYFVPDRGVTSWSAWSSLGLDKQQCFAETGKIIHKQFILLCYALYANNINKGIKMKNKMMITAALLMGLTTLGMAKSNIEKSPEGMKKLAAMSGEMSPYYRVKKEDFPKDYFLVSQNLPFLVGTALFHPKSDTLGLSKEQLAKLVEMKKTIVPVSAKMAKKVKEMEIELAKAIVIDRKDPKMQKALVGKIAEVKENMTMAHLDCIHTVQNILSKEQFETLLKLASHK